MNPQQPIGLRTLRGQFEHANLVLAGKAVGRIFGLKGWTSRTDWFWFYAGVVEGLLRAITLKEPELAINLRETLAVSAHQLDEQMEALAAAPKCDVALALHDPLEYLAKLGFVGKKLSDEVLAAGVDKDGESVAAAADEVVHTEKTTSGRAAP